MEVTVSLKNIQRSPRKIRPVLYVIRGKNVSWAINAIKFVDKACATEILSLLKSAIAAAGEHEMKESNLMVKIVKCDQAKTLKRHLYKARGRIARIQKRSSHLTITLSDNYQNSEQTKNKPSVIKEKIKKTKKTINKE